MRAQGRRIHLIDVENLLATGYLAQSAVQWLRESYLQHMGVGPEEHVIVSASSWEGAAAAGFGWPSARLLWSPGADGADRCLIDVLRNERVASRFTDVVIASGDHAFAESASTLARLGCRVTVISRGAGLSSHLRMAAGVVLTPTWLDVRPEFPCAQGWAA